MLFPPDAADCAIARLLSVFSTFVKEDLLARRCFVKRKFVLPTQLTNADWENLRIPTLFLVGENEKTYPARTAGQRLHQVAPQVEVKIAEHTDHYLLLVNPDWVVQNTLGFFQSQ